MWIQSQPRGKVLKKIAKTARFEPVISLLFSSPTQASDSTAAGCACGGICRISYRIVFPVGVGLPASSRMASNSIPDEVLSQVRRMRSPVSARRVSMVGGAERSQ